jgi:hypothetical protein
VPSGGKKVSVVVATGGGGTSSLPQPVSVSSGNIESAASAALHLIETVVGEKICMAYSSYAM